MFSGLVAALGRVERVEKVAEGARLHFVAPLPALTLGESIAVSGACLTVAALTPAGFSADLSRETLERTTLGQLNVGDAVNLERAVALGERLGGHLVTGHVDGVARVVTVEVVGDARGVVVESPETLGRFIAAKGSVTLDGVSLTVNAVSGSRFTVMLIPHTLSVTTLGRIAAGRPLNLEVDLIARYVARWLAGEPSKQSANEPRLEQRGSGL